MASLSLQAYSKKDKRLLVLFAFGVLVILCRAAILLPGPDIRQQQWRWIELPCAIPQVYRISWPDAYTLDGFPLDQLFTTSVYCGSPVAIPALGTFFNTHNAGALSVDTTPPLLTTKVSPGLAILLGQPFPINRADEAELIMLPGVGPALAANILAHRQQHGLFNDARALRAVPGIGRKLSERLQPIMSFE